MPKIFFKDENIEPLPRKLEEGVKNIRTNRGFLQPLVTGFPFSLARLSYIKHTTTVREYSNVKNLGKCNNLSYRHKIINTLSYFSIAILKSGPQRVNSGCITTRTISCRQHDLRITPPKCSMFYLHTIGVTLLAPYSGSFI